MALQDSTDLGLIFQTHQLPPGGHSTLFELSLQHYQISRPDRLASRQVSREVPVLSGWKSTGTNDAEWLRAQSLR